MKSFMNYAELKKQSSSPDLEKGQPVKEDDDDRNLLNHRFKEKVKSMKAELEDVTKLIRTLKSTARKEGMISTDDGRVMINSDHMIAVLRKAKSIKTSLEWLQKSNPEQGAVTNELRGKLMEIVQDLISLEMTGVVPEAEIVEDAELEELLAEMRVLVESNGELEITNSSSIGEEEEGVKKSGGVGNAIGVFLAERMKEQRKNYKCWIGLFLLLVLFISLASFAP